MGLLQSEITEWATDTFKGSSLKSKIIHLMKECNEAYESALLNTDTKERQNTLVEIADVGMIAMHTASMIGVDIDESSLNEYFENAMWDKLNECRGRTWGEPDADGVVEHVR